MRPLPFATPKPKWLAVAAVLAAGLIWLFWQESRRVLATPFTAWEKDAAADCAVVLTGGPNRVREGLDLLAQKQIKKLILSGVNPRSSLREIFPQLPYYGSISEDDVVLEKRSLTTYGNVQQTLALVEALKCRDLVVVTSRLHMYRAMQTFRGAFPTGFPLNEHSVFSGALEPEWDELATETLKSVFYSLWAY
ncbi:MAG TPA: YdcF family protein [Bdellovibrionales bacterium]|nr:YdcF family protein [Bdellovibrionales bacterium]